MQYAEAEERAAKREPTPADDMAPMWCHSHCFGGPYGMSRQDI
jgi:hypothetical protein